MMITNKCFLVCCLCVCAYMDMDFITVWYLRSYPSEHSSSKKFFLIVSHF